MKSLIRYWRVHFSEAGTVESVTEIRGPGDVGWIIVQAPDKDVARRKASNLYCARKKKLAVARNHAAGKCRCGRAQDRKDPRTGKPMLTCSVCAARHEVDRKGYEDRLAAGVTQHQRDEPARVASNLARQRDRRGEIRLETLIEVRNAWLNPDIGAFHRWLDGEIDRLTGASKGVAA